MKENVARGLFAKNSAQIWAIPDQPSRCDPGSLTRGDRRHAGAGVAGLGGDVASRVADQWVQEQRGVKTGEKGGALRRAGFELPFSRRRA